MSSDRAPDSLVSAWQQQPASGFRIVPSVVAGKIRKDARWSRRGFGIGLVFFAFAFVLFGALWTSQPDPIRRLAHVVQLVGIAVLVGQIVVHRQRVRAPDSMSIARRSRRWHRHAQIWRPGVRSTAASGSGRGSRRCFQVRRSTSTHRSAPV